MVTYLGLFIISRCAVNKGYFFADYFVYSCVVPVVHLENSVLQFRHCFLDYPYEQTIRLINNTNLPTCYGLLAQVKLIEIYYLVLKDKKSEGKPD